MPHPSVASSASVVRRSFLQRLGAAVAGAAAGLSGAGVATAVTPADAIAQTPRQKARHPQDAWMDAIPGQHRLVLDAVTPRGAAEALTFGWNFLRTSGQPYGLTDADHAVILILRHQATVMAVTQPIWAKYDVITNYVKKLAPFSEQPDEAPTSILRDGTDPKHPRAFTLDGLAERGVHFAICGAALGGMIQMIAGKDGDAAAIRRELEATLPANSHVMSSGITAAQRAQEYGYSYVATG